MNKENLLGLIKTNQGPARDFLGLQGVIPTGQVCDWVSKLEDTMIKDRTINDLLKANESLAKRVKELEPKKPIIPQFVATFIEDSRNKVGNIVTAIWEMYTYEHKDIYEWSLEDNNDEVLMQAFANGYEVKKEKLYKVCFMDCIEYTIYERDEDGKIIEDGMSSRGDELTEAEIKAIDERYWMFKKEVTQ